MDFPPLSENASLMSPSILSKLSLLSAVGPTERLSRPRGVAAARRNTMVTLTPLEEPRLRPVSDGMPMSSSEPTLPSRHLLSNHLSFAEKESRMTYASEHRVPAKGEYHHRSGGISINYSWYAGRQNKPKSRLAPIPTKHLAKVAMVEASLQLSASLQLIQRLDAEAEDNDSEPGDAAPVQLFATPLASHSELWPASGGGKGIAKVSSKSSRLLKEPRVARKQDRRVRLTPAVRKLLEESAAAEQRSKPRPTKAGRKCPPEIMALPALQASVRLDEMEEVISIQNSSVEFDAAAKVQTMQRKRAARRDLQAMVAEREAAATKLAATRRGHLARIRTKRQLDDREEAHFRAAARVQTAIRGKAARMELQATMATRNQAATKLAAARRGQHARRRVANMQEIMDDKGSSAILAAGDGGEQDGNDGSTA